MDVNWALDWNSTWDVDWDALFDVHWAFLDDIVWDDLLSVYWVWLWLVVVLWLIHWSRYFLAYGTINTARVAVVNFIAALWLALLWLAAAIKFWETWITECILLASFALASSARSEAWKADNLWDGARVETEGVCGTCLKFLNRLLGLTF